MIAESDLIRCLKEGMSPRQIEEALNASRNEVAHALKCAGTARCGMIRTQAMREKILKEWRKTGYDYEEISFVLGCSKALANEVIQKAKNDRKRQILAKEQSFESAEPELQWGDKTFAGQKVLVLGTADRMTKIMLLDGSVTWVDNCAVRESVGFNPKEVA